MRFVLLLAAVIALGGCAGTKLLALESAQEKVWPSAPNKARFRYVGELTGENNFKAKHKPSGIGKTLKWLLTGLVGKSKPQQLSRPQSGVVDHLGRIYVSDVNRAAVVVFDTIKGRMHVWEWATGTQRFRAPIGLAIYENRLYVADSELGYVAILDIRDGEPFGQIKKGLTRPTGIAIDYDDKRVFVADSREHAVKVYDINGKGLQSIGGYGEQDGKFNGPTYVAYAADRLYVADTLNARIQIFDRDGKFLLRFGQRGRRVGQFSRPKGIAVDRFGLIYVVESLYDHLLVFDQKGRFLLPIGGEGSGVGQFYLPAGVWVDEKAQVYIADMFNGRIVVLQYLEGA